MVRLYQLSKFDGGRRLVWTGTVDVLSGELSRYGEDDNYRWTTDFSEVQAIQEVSHG